jgi:predicted HTH transcriptional regulator
MLQALLDALTEVLAKTSEKVSVKSSEKTSEKILVLVGENPLITIAELAQVIGVAERSIERNLKKLQAEQRLSRHGPAKGGCWEVTKLNTQH